MADSRREVAAVLESERLMETVAALEHERWSHWQRYMHSTCRPSDDGSPTVPAELVSNWSQQISSPYAELSEDEKENDREQVRHYLPAIAAALKRDE
jgi:hypothetical protein